MQNPTAVLVELAHRRGSHQQLAVQGVNTHFWHYPATSSSALGSVVLLHGYRGTHEGVEAIVGALQDFDVYVPDLPGYGQSDPLRQPHSVEAYLEWLDAWLAELGLSKPFLMGHSFGTVLVAGHGARQPGSARARILVNAVSEPAMLGTKRTLLQLTRLFYRFSNLLPESIAMRVLNLRLFVRIMSEVTTKSRDRAFRRWIYEQHLTHFGTFANKSVVVEGFDASISKTVVDFSPEVLEPTLIIAGELDDVTSVSGQRGAISTFADAELCVIESVGHLTHYETPLLVAQHLREFVIRRSL